MLASDRSSPPNQIGRRRPARCTKRHAPATSRHHFAKPNTDASVAARKPRIFALSDAKRALAAETLLHWLPKPIFRGILRRLGKDELARAQQGRQRRSGFGGLISCGELNQGAERFGRLAATLF